MPATARQALVDASGSLMGTTDWRRITDPALAADGAEPIEGLGEWRWLVVRFKVPGGHAHDGTAVHGPTSRVLHLTPDLAVRAWEHGRPLAK